MKRRLPKITSITLDCLPEFIRTEAKAQRSEHIASFLYNIVLEKFPFQANGIHLPAFNELATFFTCSHMELYDAFRFLRSKGFDFTLTGLEVPVLIRQGEL